MLASRACLSPPERPTTIAVSPIDKLEAVATPRARLGAWLEIVGCTVVQRRRVDRPLDWLRFRIDTFPRSGRLTRFGCTAYQPLPWVGLHNGERNEGSISRWQVIAPLLEEERVGSAVDLGCDRGFFTLSLASAGIPTLAIENDPPAFRTALYGIQKTGYQNAGILNMTIAPANVQLLPSADAFLFLSVWHHFVRVYGFATATSMFHTIWDRTRKVLLFDTGEREMPASYRLPAMEPTPHAWISEYLADVCLGGTVIHLGKHAAFAPDRTPCLRNLFAVIR